MAVQVTRAALDAIREHAAREYPLECCGILLGQGQSVASVLATCNIHPEPATRFEIDPQALIDAHRAARAGGPQVLGYYHSHPDGPACPSATDAAMAAPDGAIWAIAGKSDVTLWRAGEAGFVALPYVVLDG